jgi:hypothetical protein
VRFTIFRKAFGCNALIRRASRATFSRKREKGSHTIYPRIIPISRFATSTKLPGVCAFSIFIATAT